MSVTALALLHIPVQLMPLRPAAAATGSWTQTDWTTPSTTLAVASSGTSQYYRPLTAGFGVLTGTFGVCAGSGAWCQGSGDTAPGQTLRLAGNWKSDAGNFYSSDLNGDGISELLFSNQWNGSTNVFDGGWVYWGQGTPASPTWNAAAGNRLELPTQTAIAVAAADLNGDGLPELIFSNYYGGSSFNVMSYIYWGQPGGGYGVTYTTTARTELPTSGAYGIAVADLNRDGRPEVIFSNWYDGSSRNINSYIYWGQAGGTYGVNYSAAARTSLPTSGAMGTAVADLNSDGIPEVIFVNQHDGTSYNLNSYIYWGQAGGAYGVTYTTAARTDLPTIGAHGVTIADLNSDGRPEIVFANSQDASTYNVSSYIYWAQAGGTYGVLYSPSYRTNLPGVGAHKVSAADINGDGQRDVVIQNYHGGFTRIFWGSLPTAGTATLSWTLPITFGFRGLSLSDLNNDGRLDLLTAREGLDPVNNYWAGGTSGRVYFHNGNNSSPYNTTPNFDLPVQSATGAYASFGPGRGSNADWINQPRPVYGATFPAFGVLESMVMDSGQNGSIWQSAQANTQIAAGAGITLFVAASDSLSALNNPTWTQVGAMTNGTWTQTLSSVTGRYARYRVVLWRNRTTEASPALQSITFNYITQAGAFSKSSPSNGATSQPISLNLSWGASSGVNHYRYCFATSPGCTPATGNGTATIVALSGLTPGTTYYWQARACADSACTVFTDADAGAHWSFTTLNPPGAFSKSSPGNGATGQPANPTLSWGASSGVNHYRYCYSTTSGCAPVTSAGTNTSVTLSSLTPGTTYYWQARACADSACTVFTDADGGAYWWFTTAATVGGFNKLAPGNSAVNINTATAQLQWSIAAGATDYKLCLGTALNTCDILGGAPGQYASAGNSYFRVLSDLPLLPNTTYYWQALATNGTYTTFANGGPLAFWSFTTLPNGPDAFAKLSPAFNATNVPTQNLTLHWQAATGAVSYTVCIGAFAGDCSYTITATGTSAVLPGPLPAGATLVWQVTAHNAGGSTSADSNTWWPFTTLPNAPQSFSKLNPPNGATGQPIGLNLTWQDTPDEEYYTVCVGPSIGLCSLVNTTTTQNITTYALTGLDYGTAFWWQISACNPGGCTPANNGNAWSFSTLNPPAPGPFHKQHPANAATGAPADPAQVLLQWSPADNADGYEVCFGTQPATCDLSGGGFQNVGNFTSRLVSQLPVSVTLQPASTYWWQVRAYNTVTATRTFADGGVDFFFTTANVSGPAAFSKDAPVNNTFNLPTASVTLRWFPAGGAQSYDICAGSAPNVCDALPGNAWLNVGTATAYTLTSLQPGATYWWQVRALNTAGQTQANAGVWWTFHTQNQQPPAEFSKSAPPHTTLGVPTATAVLSWFVSTGATRYEVCLGSAPGLCEASEGWIDAGSATSWSPTLQPATTYWWQVRALGSSFSVQANGGQWWAFTTVNDAVNGPGAFQKTAPLSGTIVGSSLVLSWTTSSGATGYRVCVGTAWGLCDVIPNASVVSTSYALNGLPSGEYWWQVTAVDADGDTTQADNGARWQFEVGSGNITDLDNSDTRKDVTATAVRMGEALTYTIVLSNSGALPMSVRVTDTLPVSATLLSATPGYTQTGQTLAWSGVIVPANSAATLTITVRAGSGPLPDGYTLSNNVTIATHDGAITRDAPAVSVTAWRAFAPIVIREP